MVNFSKEFKLKSYKELVAWQKAYQLCLRIFSLTKILPNTEQFGLSSQLKRSALSVPSNIAEGYARNSTQEYIRFLYISYGSLAELETQLLLTKDLNYIKASEFNEIFQMHEELQKVLYGLIKSLRLKTKPSPLTPKPCTLNPKSYTLTPK